MDVLALYPKEMCHSKVEEFHLRAKERWGESIFREVTESETIWAPSEEHLGEKHNKVAKTIRSSLYYNSIEQLPVEDVNIFPKAGLHPIIFEEVYSLKNKRVEKGFADADQVKASRDGIHLIVLVHGFQGNSYDLRLVKNNISLLHPDVVFLSSSANEDFSEYDIDEQGQRLSQEVTQFVSNYYPGELMSSLSFIGHSLGGLVIRAALPRLTDFKDKMRTYISFSSPHLGYMYH